MDVIFSIRKNFLDLIFDGTKNIEFRKRIGKDIHEGDTIYFYETKAAGGSGMVVGEAKIKNIKPIERKKIGSYILLPYYVEKYGSEEEKEQIKKILDIHVSGYDDSVVLSYIFDNWSLDYMKKNDRLPDPRRNPIWKDASVYNDTHWKAQMLCERADRWGKQIGFYDTLDECCWNWIIELENPIKYSSEKYINEFTDKSGLSRITSAPQSWCYTGGKV